LQKEHGAALAGYPARFARAGGRADACLKRRAMPMRPGLPPCSKISLITPSMLPSSA
jgi:hypothetical protein